MSENFSITKMLKDMIIGKLSAAEGNLLVMINEPKSIPEHTNFAEHSFKLLEEVEHYRSLLTEIERYETVRD